MLFSVTVQKGYVRLSGHPRHRTVYGHIHVEAETSMLAKVKVSEMIEGGLQTVDPRITWKEDFRELAKDGWDYRDWSFIRSVGVRARPVDWNNS